MCLRLDVASIVVSSGYRPDPLAFSDARLGEGRLHIGEPMFFMVNARIVPCDSVLAAAWPALPCE
jgi:hypothetical protein